MLDKDDRCVLCEAKEPHVRHEYRYRLELRVNGHLRKTVVDLKLWQARYLKGMYQKKGYQTLILKAKAHGTQLDDNGPSRQGTRDQGAGSRESGVGENDSDPNSTKTFDPEC